MRGGFATLYPYLDLYISILVLDKIKIAQFNKDLDFHSGCLLHNCVSQQVHQIHNPFQVLSITEFKKQNKTQNSNINNKMQP